MDKSLENIENIWENPISTEVSMETIEDTMVNEDMVHVLDWVRTPNVT